MRAPAGGRPRPASRPAPSFPSSSASESAPELYRVAIGRRAPHRLLHALPRARNRPQGPRRSARAMRSSCASSRAGSLIAARRAPARRTRQATAASPSRARPLDSRRRAPADAAAFAARRPPSRRHGARAARPGASPPRRPREDDGGGDATELAARMEAKGMPAEGDALDGLSARDRRRPLRDGRRGTAGDARRREPTSQGGPAGRSLRRNSAISSGTSSSSFPKPSCRAFSPALLRAMAIARVRGRAAASVTLALQSSARSRGQLGYRALPLRPGRG